MRGDEPEKLNKGTNIGYSSIGGFFIGQNITSDFHQDHTISIALSLGDKFEFIEESEGKSHMFSMVLVGRNVKFYLKTADNDPVVFMHIDPFSEQGMSIDMGGHSYLECAGNTKVLIASFTEWMTSAKRSGELTQTLINQTIQHINTSSGQSRRPDERIMKAMRIVKEANIVKFFVSDIANEVNLSPGRFAHLFKEQTGITFKKYVLHCKLLKSLYAMHQKNNLTHASHEGGFADQPHFTRTFKNAFGIKPSTSKTS